MALQSIPDSVRAKLPFLDANTTGTDTIINQIKTEQYYYLSPYTKLTGSDIEDDSKYAGLQILLVTEMVCVEFLKKETLKNVAGTAGAAGTGAKRISKGKADVVEAEFEYGKAADGNFLGATAEELLLQHTRKACEYAKMLKYSLPLCIGVLDMPFDTPPFLGFVDNCGCC